MSSKGNPGKWDFPGGKIDAGENFHEALIREVAEETGLTVSIERAVGTANSDLPTVKVVILILEGRLESGQMRLSTEHDDYVWVDRRELAKLDLCDQFLSFAQAYSQEVGCATKNNSCLSCFRDY